MQSLPPCTIAAVRAAHDNAVAPESFKRRRLGLLALLWLASGFVAVAGRCPCPGLASSRRGITTFTYALQGRQGPVEEQQRRRSARRHGVCRLPGHAGGHATRPAPPTSGARILAEVGEPARVGGRRRQPPHDGQRSAATGLRVGMGGCSCSNAAGKEAEHRRQTVQCFINTAGWGQRWSV